VFLPDQFPALCKVSKKASKNHNGSGLSLFALNPRRLQLIVGGVNTPFEKQKGFPGEAFQ
jgi:hypothetical protein